MRTLLLGVVLLVAGLGLSWAQDVAAPWINVAEAQMGTPLGFSGDGGRYRVITSGPLRPALESTSCRVEPEDARAFTVLGGEDVNAATHFGVTRALSFAVGRGDVRLTCGDRRLPSSRSGRYQVVAADGPANRVIEVLLVLAVALVVVGAVRLLLALRRARA